MAIGEVGKRKLARAVGVGMYTETSTSRVSDRAAAAAESANQGAMHAILEMARWAPSGDNTQPWRFEILGPQTAVVHGFDTRSHCVYDLDGRPSQLSLGALIETACVAATAHGKRLIATLREGLPDTTPTFDLLLEDDPACTRSPLFEAITLRSVQRRPMSTRALTAEQRASLDASVGHEHHVLWVDGPAGRRRAAGVLWRSARLRLTLPEAYPVHRDVIAWNSRYSDDRVPDQALGASAPTLRLMRFGLGSWKRVQFLNRFMAGTWVPRIELDVLPALACAGHFLIVGRAAPATLKDYVAGGRALQRFWLTAATLGLGLQPEVTPLVFARYARTGLPFSTDVQMAHSAKGVRADLESLWGHEAADRAVFMGRVGVSAPPRARSLRLALDALLRR